MIDFENILKLPENSITPCMYFFQGMAHPEKGLIQVTDKCVFIKHNHRNNAGGGDIIKPYRHSWFLCHRGGQEKDIRNILDIQLCDDGYVTLGEL
jgi:hypothetical protein